MGKHLSMDIRIIVIINNYLKTLKKIDRLDIGRQFTIKLLSPFSQIFGNISFPESKELVSS